MSKGWRGGWGGIIVWSVLLPVAALITQDWFRKCRLECQRASCGEVEHFSGFGQPCPGNHYSQPGRALQHSPDWAPQSNKVLLPEPEILPGFDKPVDCPWSSWDIAFFAAQPCMESGTHLPALWAWALHRKFKMSLKVTFLLKKKEKKKKSNNSTSFEGYITRDHLVSCHVTLWNHFGAFSLHFPCDFWLLPRFLWPCFSVWHQGSPWGNIHPTLS